MRCPAGATIELGGLAQDTIELRDGTVLTGDAISMSLTDGVIRVDGKEAKYDRNPEQPPVTKPVNAGTKQ